MNTSGKIIIWDFDGTMYPIAPYDCECYMLKIAQSELAFFSSAAAALRIRLDQKQLFSKHFKKHYIKLLNGCDKSLIDRAAEYIAGTIPKTETEHYRELKNRGWEQYIISCGTYDICIRVLAILGISDCFTEITANKFTFSKDKISGMDITVNDGEIKRKIMEKIIESRNESGVTFSQVVAVGDGYTDIPILNRVKTPILIDWFRKKSLKFTKTIFIPITRPSEVMGIISDLEN
ncbi:MAG: haloacid dehalogenase-like hydrolase [Bacteroidetes bacterium]|nr:haloacid dehalogenase-like hydrolase [Bacteroidota bacterium]